jgi:thymidylate synthase
MILPFNNHWLLVLQRLLLNGAKASPRGKDTLELTHQTTVVDMRSPVLTIKERKLGYQFMAAEAYWILSGDNRVETIAPYSNRIADFSDDGKTFFGAYGPKIVNQLDHVVHALKTDPHTRQAGLTIWRENPPDTKDVPCTVAIFFSVRGRRLDCHVFMRSSDVWLGLPYDVFNFSMLGHLVCGHLHEALGCRPGLLYLTAVNQHLYVENVDQAKECEVLMKGQIGGSFRVPAPLYREPELLMETLKELRNARPGDPIRWWED